MHRSLAVFRKQFYEVYEKSVASLDSREKQIPPNEKSLSSLTIHETKNLLAFLLIEKQKKNVAKRENAGTLKNLSTQDPLVENSDTFNILCAKIGAFHLPIMFFFIKTSEASFWK